eukprot:CAMPEP_0202902616 /NCGR_PEP_ID=MMETSP1392-20130828/16957_1 /ASSEMBLY_ACC=CAM_ASM_000868 /TAXON_ID=225041 /ORGANISM="Chlamydomonas chlamydogama, Strain SAG 11-48b" /LENGTH=80 /DNA_ID=CAMNT_0049589407 /DNA_START=629 /DNA_END=871 /DNA_ORIENTATION=-
MLMYPVGAQSVKCSVCHCVTPVGAGPPPGAGPSHAGAAGAAAGRAAAKPNQTVVVENPPTLDSQGNEVANIAVGVKADQQ